jgi:hypothetical protein
VIIENDIVIARHAIGDCVKWPKQETPNEVSESSTIDGTLSKKNVM